MGAYCSWHYRNGLETGWLALDLAHHGRQDSAYPLSYLAPVSVICSTKGKAFSFLFDGLCVQGLGNNDSSFVTNLMLLAA